MTRLARMIGMMAMLAAGRPDAAIAQSKQPLSVEVAGGAIGAIDHQSTFDPNGRSILELQTRYTFSRFSIGAGVELQSAQNSLRQVRASVFAEPRLVVAAGAGKAGYLAIRVGAGKFICARGCTGYGPNVTAGGGGGVLLRISPRLAADIGLEYLRVVKWASSAYLTGRVGLSVGL